MVLFLLKCKYIVFPLAYSVYIIDHLCYGYVFEVFDYNFLYKSRTGINKPEGTYKTNMFMANYADF